MQVSTESNEVVYNMYAYKIFNTATHHAEYTVKSAGNSKIIPDGNIKYSQSLF